MIVNKDDSLPLVTIMIPTYNQAVFLEHAVDSALAQDYPFLEVIVCNDCSKDNTEEILKKYDDSRLRWFTNETNLGRVGNYHNLLFNHACGEWVLNLDGDDFLIDSTYISSAVRALVNNTDAVLAFADYYELENGQSVPKACNSAETAPVSIFNGWRYFFSWPRKNKLMNHLSCLYSRQKAITTGFYTCDIISSDYQSVFRLIPRGDILWLDCKAGVWRKHGQNASSLKNNREKIKDFSFVTTVYDYLEKQTDQPFKLYCWKLRNLRRKIYAYLVSAMRNKDYSSIVLLFTENTHTSSLLVLSVLFSPIVWIKLVRNLARKKPGQCRRSQ